MFLWSALDSTATSQNVLATGLGVWFDMGPGQIPKDCGAFTSEIGCAEGHRKPAREIGVTSHLFGGSSGAAAALPGARDSAPELGCLGRMSSSSESFRSSVAVLRLGLEFLAMDILQLRKASFLAVDDANTKNKAVDIY